MLEIYEWSSHLGEGSLHFESLVTVCFGLAKSLKSWLLVLAHILRVKFFYICTQVFFILLLRFFVTIYFANCDLWLGSFLIWWMPVDSLFEINWWSSLTTLNLFIKPHLKLDQLPFHLLKHFVIPRSFMSFLDLPFQISHNSFQIWILFLHFHNSRLHLMSILVPSILFSFPVFNTRLQIFYVQPHLLLNSDVHSNITFQLLH